MLQFTVKKCSKMNILQNNSLVVGIIKTADCLEAFCKKKCDNYKYNKGSNIAPEGQS